MCLSVSHSCIITSSQVVSSSQSPHHQSGIVSSSHCRITALSHPLILSSAQRPHHHIVGSSHRSTALSSHPLGAASSSHRPITTSSRCRLPHHQSVDRQVVAFRLIIASSHPRILSSWHRLIITSPHCLILSSSHRPVISSSHQHHLIASCGRMMSLGADTWCSSAS